MQVAVIGAGIVGCAIAYELSSNKLSVVVLERHSRIAEEITSRNSGVIHSGIYYPPGSLKAESCIQGNALLYEWCQQKGVPHRKIGKWVVAQKDTEEDLSNLYHNALACGVSKIRYLSQDEIAQNPAIHCSSALSLSETGIVDAYEYANSFRVAAEENQTQFIFNVTVTGIQPRSRNGYLIETSRGPLETDVVVNCAGLYSDEIARLAGVHSYRIYPWRGDYFALKSFNLPEHLIYPVKKPGAPGLGVHFTLGLDGSGLLGPDVELSFSKNDFSPPDHLELKRQSFFESARKFLPSLQLSDLTYAYCGIRPKLRSPTDLHEHDFILRQDLPGWINLVGIESPGLTASRALAQKVSSLIISSGV